MVKSEEVARVGLCIFCRHKQEVMSDRGSRFYRCGLAAVDPRFPKYPRLPVLRCHGFEPTEESKKPNL